MFIKLDAIHSTNDFLKEFISHNKAENYMIVSAKHQTNGRGQRGTTWTSEYGKNLLMSTLVSYPKDQNITIFDFNIAVAVAVFSVFDAIKKDFFSIKWPNDIMAGSKKIGGILIENQFQSDKINAIVGIGININQTNFETLPTATSLANEMGYSFEIEHIILRIVAEIKLKTANLNSITIDNLWETYHKNLFKINQLMFFEDKDNKAFLGIIKKVHRNGKIEIMKDNLSFLYDIKDIKMLY